MRTFQCKERFVKDGERIGQVVFIPYVNVDFAEVDNLDLTERGDKGFGSNVNTATK